MRLAEAARVAWEALRANRLRSGLTMFGVVIGVASVVVLVAIGTGARNEVTSGVESLGSNILFVAPGNLSFGSTPALSRLGLDDVRRVGDAIGDPRRVATTIASGEIARVGARRTNVNVNGTNETIPLVFDRILSRGSFFTAADVETRRRVAVLGADPGDLARGDGGGDPAGVADGVADAAHVVQAEARQRRGGAERQVAGRHEQDVGAQRLHARGDLVAGAGADRHQQDHAGHADDHAEHGEPGAQLVGPQRLPRDPGRLAQSHRGTPLGTF